MLNYFLTFFCKYPSPNLWNEMVELKLDPISNDMIYIRIIVRTKGFMVFSQFPYQFITILALNIRPSWRSIHRKFNMQVILFSENEIEFLHCVATINCLNNHLLYTQGLHAYLSGEL